MDGPDDLTRTSSTPASAQSSRRSGSGPVGLVDAGRFPAGTVLAGRYRIVELLGRGGMGEVYRADDLRLHQSVALKFLLREAHDPQRLADLHSEVRIARQISHPGVCRVYDIGEVDGHAFLTMEYVDGEHLGRLLQRVGRLSREKALDVARQLGAALAAAHQLGIVHRDLKPSNVMVDGRGRARITDFGLAVFAQDISGSSRLVGTPAYMAPEQLAGAEATVASDVYAFGLVLYELFTGRRTHEARSVAELSRLHASGRLPRPSVHAPDIDPLVEHVIQHCLEPDPAARPRSMQSVLAALPGGDPLAAALAAGETPSPEIVAAAGGVGALSRRTAGTLLGLTIACTTLIAWMQTDVRRYGQTPLTRPPEVLAYECGNLLKAMIGQDALDAAPHAVYSFRRADGAIELALGLHAATRSGSSPTTYFWYRRSPEPLVSQSWSSSYGRVTETDPPRTTPGMLSVATDAQGRLRSLERVPAAAAATSSTSSAAAAQGPPAVDWSALLSAAGLDVAALSPEAPDFTPAVYCDMRAQWSGPGQTRIRAATLEGVPVLFRIDVAEPPSVAAAPRTARFWALAIFGPVALVLALRNLRLQRCDKRGAKRLAIAVLAVELVLVVTQGSHALTQTGFELAQMKFAWAVLQAAAVWVLYLAIEPAIRRLWPQVMVSWVRLLNGGWTDPLVGRDLLLGVLTGALLQLLLGSITLLFGLEVSASAMQALVRETLLGPRQYVFILLAVLSTAVTMTMLAVLVLVVIRLICRRNWLAELLFVALIALQGASAWLAEFPWQPVVLLALVNAAFGVYVLTRLGLLTLLVLQLTVWLAAFYPLSLDLTTFYAPASATALLALLGIAGWGAYATVRPALMQRPGAGGTARPSEAL